MIDKEGGIIRHPRPEKEKSKEQVEWEVQQSEVSRALYERQSGEDSDLQSDQKSLSEEEIQAKSLETKRKHLEGEPVDTENLLNNKTK